MPDTCVGRDSKPLTGTMLQKPMTSASSCSLVFGMVFLFFIGQAASPTLPLVRAFNGDQSGTRAGELLSHSAPAQMLAPGREFSRLPETEHSLDKTSQTNSMPAGMAYIFSIAIAVGPASTSAGPINPQTYPPEDPQYSPEALAAEAQPLSRQLFAAAPPKTLTDASSFSSSGRKQPGGLFGQDIPISKSLARKGLAPQSSPETILEAFLDIPYRNDGTIDELGEYTLFAKPEARFSSPGLNCSGLVLSASRFLLGKNFTLDEAKRDRLGDSGPGSPHGEDWDFGWDLIMNISEGFKRTLLLPGNTLADPAAATGFSPRGFDIHDDATWTELPARLRPGYVYLVSLNMDGRRKGYTMVHYHVGLVHVSASGEAWFYQTTGKGDKSNRRDLKTARGQASFKRAFANTSKNRKMMLVLEVKLP